MKRDFVFLHVNLIIILCVSFSIAQDYSNMSMEDLLSAYGNTNTALGLFNDEDELTEVREERSVRRGFKISDASLYISCSGKTGNGRKDQPMARST